MSVKDAVRSITFDHFDATTLTDAYQLVSTAGLSAPCFFIRIINASNAFILISYDGAFDHDCVQLGSTLDINFQTNSRPSNWVANMQQGQKIWLKLWKPYVVPKPLIGMIYFAGFTSNY
jgi:hypothetical protein